MQSIEEKLGYTPEVRGVESAEKEVNGISSRLLDLMGVQGKIGGTASVINQCNSIDPDFKKYYSVHHPWSVYDLQRGTFAGAMRNLRNQLPKEGWRITKDGVTKSIAKDPQIVAVDEKSHHSVTIEWLKRTSGDLKPMISVDVDSRCYQAPEGTDLSTFT